MEDINSEFQSNFRDRLAELREARPAPLAPPLRDGFTTPLDPGLQRTVIVKFTKQARYKNKGGDDYTDRTFVVRDTVECLARLVKGEKTQKVPLETPRESLGDLDPRHWPIGPDGMPADPWAKVAEVAMVSAETGAAAVFSSTSKTGRGAIADLKSAVQFRRQTVNPVALPVIQLAVKIWASPKWGDTPIPDLRIVGWVDAAPQIIEAKAIEQLTGQRPAEEIPQPRKRRSAERRQRLLDDDSDNPLPNDTIGF